MCLYLCFSLLTAQGYNTAFGVRLGNEFGMTVQQRIAKRATIEGLLQYDRRQEESSASVLFQQHMPLLLRSINVYTGIGPNYRWSDSPEATLDANWGLGLVAGFEMSIGRMNLSWDYKPVIHLAGGNSSFQGQSAISVRYIVAKRRKGNGNGLAFWKGDPKKRKKRQRQKRKRQRQSS